MISENSRILIDTAIIVAIITVVGTIIQYIIAPILEERRKAKEKGD